MNNRYVLALGLLLVALQAAAQDDSPYAKFGYEGRVLRTPQERRQYMLLVPNADTTAMVASIGIDSQKGKYYLFDKQYNILGADSLLPEQLSRFLSVDPLTKNYPELTPYQFASNTPVQAIDLDGLEMYFATDGNLLGKFGDNTSIRIISNKETAQNIKADVNAKLNSAPKDYPSYKLSMQVLNESLRQIDVTRKSDQPLGFASIVNSNGVVTQGTSQKAFLDDGQLTTPEVLPPFTLPSTSEEKDGFTIIHSHLLDAFTANSDGSFSKLQYGTSLPSGSTTVYNIGQNGIVNPSPKDKSSSINGNNYNLILIGNISPIQNRETNPMQSNSPRAISSGTAGANFYKGSFSSSQFSMSENALKKVKKTVEKSK